MAEYDRRQLLLASAIGVAALAPPVWGARLVQLDGAVQSLQSLQNHDPFQIHEIDDQTSRTLAHSNVYIGAGFNARDSRPAAEHMRDVLRYHGSVYAVNYGANFDIASVIGSIADHAEETDAKEVMLVGLSLGGLIGLSTAAELKARDITVPGIVLMSTPSSPDTVKMWSDLIDSGITEVLVEYDLTGGTYTRTVGNVVQQKVEDLRRLLQTGKWPTESLPESVRRAVHRQRYEDLPDLTCLQQLNYLNKVDLPATMAALPPEMRLRYIHAGQYHEDTVVDTSRALDGFRRAGRPSGKTISSYHIPDGGHADPGRHPEHYRRVLALAAASMRWPDSRTVLDR